MHTGPTESFAIIHLSKIIQPTTFSDIHSVKSEYLDTMSVMWLHTQAASWSSSSLTPSCLSSSDLSMEIKKGKERKKERNIGMIFR